MSLLNENIPIQLGQAKHARDTSAENHTSFAPIQGILYSTNARNDLFKSIVALVPNHLAKPWRVGDSHVGYSDCSVRWKTLVATWNLRLM